MISAVHQGVTWSYLADRHDVERLNGTCGLLLTQCDHDPNLHDSADPFRSARCGTVASDRA